MNSILPITRPSEPLDEIELATWIGRAAPGEIIEYHRGFLAIDRMTTGSPRADAARRRLAAVAARALWAADRDLVHLLQRRLGPDDYAYLAVVRPKPRRKAVPLSHLAQEDAA